MPYDPAFPADNALIESLPFRNQFGSIVSLITAIQTIIAAQVDGVSTVGPTDPAAVTLSVTGDTLHFTFAIPRGNDGVPGAQGIPGVEGAQGPPFAQIVIDAVNTLLPGENATVTVSFDGTLVHLTFGIPRGAEGVQGPPGEVTNAQLTAEISTAVGGTSSNTNAVPTMDTPFTNDPPTLADMETMRAAHNAFVLAARRP